MWSWIGGGVCVLQMAGCAVLLQSHFDCCSTPVRQVRRLISVDRAIPHRPCASFVGSGFFAFAIGLARSNIFYPIKNFGNDLMLPPLCMPNCA